VSEATSSEAKGSLKKLLSTFEKQKISRIWLKFELYVALYAINIDYITSSAAQEGERKGSLSGLSPSDSGTYESRHILRKA